MSVHVAVEANQNQQFEVEHRICQKYIEMIRYVCVTFAILAGFMVAAVTDEELKNIRGFMAKTADACMKEFSVSMEDFDKAKKDKDLGSIKGCFIACVFKGRGLINAKGMFDPKIGNDIAEKFIKSPDDIAKVKKISEICTSVNDEQVSDGDEGCERAVLLLQCLLENKSQTV